MALLGLQDIHYTIGGPYFPEYANCPLADEWRAEREAMLYAASRR